MPRITILPESIANKIAAGEVVERPASVVKELIENSIDADAKQITVMLTVGGKRSITVSDDGCGMTQDDALLAFERHATSKIRSETDLDHIKTLGFRGEALPSIAAVSKLVLVTRTTENLAGTRVILEGGVVKDVSDVGAPLGTRVTVNHLYFNTPARAKFLKSTATEVAHSVEIVQRHALAREDVGFRLIHNGKQLFDLPRSYSLADKAALIWGPTFARDMVDVELEQDGVTVTGLVGRPSLYRAQKNMQLFFLNRRPVQNRVLSRAVSDAYSGLLPIGKSPVAILFVAVDPVEADVNVHPTKREAKFRHEREVYNAVVSAIQRSLEKKPVTPLRTPFVRPPTPIETRHEEPKVQTPRVEKAPVIVQDIPDDVPAREVGIETPIAQPKRAEPAAKPARTPSPESTERPPITVSPLFTPETEPTEAPLQVFGTYLVAPQHDRLLIIDQHALHERLTYERLKRDISGNRLPMQNLLVPINIEFTPAHAKLIEQYLHLLESIGIQMEHFGGTSFIVTALYDQFSESKVEELLRHIVSEIEQGDLLENQQQLKERLLVLSVSACRSSIKAGEALTLKQRAELLAGLRQLSPPYTCPHGRPIMTELTLDQLERGFKRR